jgi:hypothetical protein
MRRRDLLKTGAILAGASSLMLPPMWADVPDHLWEGYQSCGCWIRTSSVYSFVGFPSPASYQKTAPLVIVGRV